MELLQAHAHTPLKESLLHALSHFYMLVSLALVWATALLADSFCSGITALRILHRHGEQSPGKSLGPITSFSGSPEES